MFEIGNDLVWAKKELSKANNLDNMPKRYKQQCSTLEAYYKEAVLLHEEVIQGAKSTVLEREQYIFLYMDSIRKRNSRSYDELF